MRNPSIYGQIPKEPEVQPCYLKSLQKAQKADFWIASGDFSSLKEMTDSNPHYNQFASFKNKKVYSYSLNKGAKGGIIYFELASSRPDLVLKDFIKIVHRIVAES